MVHFPNWRLETSVEGKRETLVEGGGMKRRGDFRNKGKRDGGMTGEGSMKG